MPFHVEISGGIDHARVFNLSAEELRRNVLEPWRAGGTVELGEKEWPAPESSLRVLEGPHLGQPDLSFGQGWSNAERVSEDVTRRELAQTKPPSLPDAFVVETELPEATVGEMLAGRGAEPIDFAQAQQRLDGRDAEVAAVVLVVRRSEPGAPRS